MLCKNCGTKLKQGDNICPNCGYNNINLPYSSTNLNTTTVLTPSDEEKAEQKTSENPKKSKATLIVSIIIIAILIIAIGIGVIYWIITLNDTSQNAGDTNATEATTEMSTEATVPPEINIDDYYISGGSVTYIADPDNPVAVTFTNKDDPDGEPQALTLNEDKYAFDGQTFYCQQYSNNVSDFYKYTFVTKTTLVKSVWITQDNLKKYLFGTNTYADYTDDLFCWEYYDNNIYFSKRSSLLENFESDADNLTLIGYEMPYLLIKISTDGTSIKVINQIANDLTINDGWIYYYDNGLTLITKEMTEIEEYDTTYYIDYERVGIYKMNTDGNNKQLLKAGNIPNFDETYNSISIYDKLSVFGEYLYFIDNSGEGNGRICRMKLDSSDFEYLSTNTVKEFTVDEKSNTLYYSVKVIREPQKIIQVSLKDKTEKEIVSVDTIRDSKLEFKNNNLYFTNNYLFESASKELVTCGAKYNFSTSKLEYLQRYYNVEEIKEDIFTKQIINGPYFYWEELTDKNGYFKQ